MNFKYIDIHSHLNFPEYDIDRKEVIQRMKDEDIATICIGTDLKNSREVVDLANNNENIFACIGIHPADNHAEVFDEKEYEEMVNNPKVVAVGECGLDYARLPDDTEIEKKRQRDLFANQIAFAAKHKKPLMIHSRDAYKDVYDVLSSEQKILGKELVKANMHFFSGNVDEARKFLDIGCTISFTGVITFASQYNDVVKFVPMDKIMTETDAPYVAPIPFRGKRNEPGYVKEVYKAMAIIRVEEEEDLRKQVRENVFKYFGF